MVLYYRLELSIENKEITQNIQTYSLRKYLHQENKSSDYYFRQMIFSFTAANKKCFAKDDKFEKRSFK